MKKIVIAMAMMGLLTISSCGKEDNNSSDKGGKEQTIPSNYYVVSPDGTTLMKWFNTEVTSIDMQSDKVLSKITKITAEFGDCEKLTSVVLPSSLITIGGGAFTGCSSLSSITLPNSLTTIGEDAFNECSALTSIVLPNSLTTIGNDAFSGTKLTSLTIPKNVTNIGKGVFYLADLLKTIIFEGEVPPTINRWLFDSRYIETIYVPTGSVDRYKNTEGFKEYADKIKAKP
ncbi:leucine-rich repeat protein [Capnocytophaga gingivalis]|jgi:putative surface protein bspA-like|uniref:leucine-rich repeat domain-containing protein n=1 Tax=Capnocytophaga gingivalis TaxID=1017 RepID=UPI0028D3B1B3|nr:leucine-rich repeat protein [Capnocytophaga gingivalis]